MAKQDIKPSSYFLAAFCCLALLIFNIIEDNLYSAIILFSLFFLTLTLGINKRFHVLKLKDKKGKSGASFKTFQ